MKLARFGVLLACSLAQASLRAQEAPHDCVMLVALDASLAYTNDATECSHATAPASTFKLPHVLIALGSGVVTDPHALESWDGTEYRNAAWRRDHSLHSAVQWSALWFFQRIALRIGRERMLSGLQALDYAADRYDGEQTTFWLDGDLLVTPREQLRFLQRLLRNELPVPAQHSDVLKAAFLMPPGKVTLGIGEVDFMLAWPALGAVHAKPGNASVNGEAVSWLVGYFEADTRQYAFVVRRRAASALALTAALELAQQELNRLVPRP